MEGIVYEKETDFPVSQSNLWNWHARPGAFERLVPAWQHLVPVELPETLEDSAEVRFKMRIGPFNRSWHARLSPVDPFHRFVDTQVSGPFRNWQHEHLMEKIDELNSRLKDKVEFSLPAGIGKLSFVRKLALNEIERLFRFRHHRMLLDMQRYQEGRLGSGKLVLVTGSSGLVGSRLVPFLKTLGYQVKGLTRGSGGKDLYTWDPEAGKIDREAMDGIDAVVHLAGENIAGGRWTAKRRQRILDSRVKGTRTLVEAMGAAKKVPNVFICASGVNTYGSSSDVVDEQSPVGEGFLAEVCHRWEAEAMRATNYGIRTVCLRTGVVLDPLGGALGKLLPLFRIGLGGRVGSGDQGFPWIVMDDLLDIFVWAMEREGLSGPVNAVHPELISQGEFSRALAKVLRRTSWLPLPGFVIKVLFGKMGEETLLADLRVKPDILLNGGFTYRYANLSEALSCILGKSIQ